MDHMTRATLFSGMIGIRRLSLEIACKHTKFEICKFTHSRDISGGVKF